MINNENKNINNIIKDMDNPLETNNENNNSIITSRIDLVSSSNNQSDNNNISNSNQSLRVIKSLKKSFYPKVKIIIYAFRNLWLNLKNILSDGLFNFYIIRENFNNKEIMLLPCGHIYHSICLKEWLERKKICPICSKKIPEL